jgi:hypothetical protein
MRTQIPHQEIKPMHQHTTTPPAHNNTGIENTTEHRKLHKKKSADRYGQVSQPKGIKKEVKKTTKQKPLQL